MAGKDKRVTDVVASWMVNIHMIRIVRERRKSWSQKTGIEGELDCLDLNCFD